MVGIVVEEGAVRRGRLLVVGSARRGGTCCLLLIYAYPLHFCLAVPTKPYLSRYTACDDLGRYSFPCKPCISMWIDGILSLELIFYHLVQFGARNQTDIIQILKSDLTQNNNTFNI